MIVISIAADLILMAFLATGFQAADMDDTGSLISCLDAISTHPFFIGVKEESFSLLRINPGDRVLEVGCGTGTDARRLAYITGPGGLVAGVDPGVNMLNEAVRSGWTDDLCESSNRGDPSFFRMDGRFLGFPDSFFDVVREDRALQHIENPHLVIREMLRVLRPEGRFVLFEPDWELFIIDGAGRELTRKILNFWADKFMNGWIGRELCRICLDAGAGEVIVHPRTMILHDLPTCDRIFGILETVSLAVDSGSIDRQEAMRWVSSLQNANRSGRFFASFTGFLVQGKKV